MVLRRWRQAVVLSGLLVAIDILVGLLIPIFAFSRVWLSMLSVAIGIRAISAMMSERMSNCLGQEHGLHVRFRSASTT